MKGDRTTLAWKAVCVGCDVAYGRAPMKTRLLVVLCSVLAVGCASKKSAEQPHSGANATTTGNQASARIEAKSGSNVEGEAVFRPEGGQIVLVLQVKNLPAGQHAAHLHEKGDCSAQDGSSAGGHWNPTTDEHGKWGEGAHHLGDLGNIDVAADGKGEITLTTDKWSIGTGNANDIVGKAIIVHEKQDDFTTQPTGNAGGRIGCGVVIAGRGG